MALRKEEFYYDPQEHKQMEKKQSDKRRRITIDISAELDERIEANAKQENLSAAQYVEKLLGEVVPRKVDIKRPRRPVTLEDVEKLMQVRDRMLEEHGGIPFEDSVELLRQEREEREKELGF